MKKILSIVFALSMFASVSFAQKILTVDMTQVQKEYSKWEQSRQFLKTSAESVQKEVEKMQADGKDLISKLQALQEEVKNPALSEEAKQTKSQEFQVIAQQLQAKENTIKQYVAENQQIMQNSANTQNAERVKEVKAACDIIAKEKGADVVLTEAVLLYSADSIDITAELIKALNK